jgi:threonylcarbamoyladenosine tRNA methylthiotransferase CDKAL1
VSRVELDVAQGVREFWLTSQDTACYGRDLGADLAELVERVCGVDGDFLVRVGMMTPNNLVGISDDLLEAFESSKVFKFLHLPVQSGDDGVLRRMNRFYSVRDFVAVVERFRRAFPRLTVATDVIVGFPGETEREFDRTLGLVEEVKPDVTNVSKFFARPMTAACGMEARVSSREVKRRSASLAGLARRVALERNRGWAGWSGRVLVDEVGRPGSVVGRNFAYKPVVLRSRGVRGLLGKFIDVKVTGAFQSHLLGEVL